MNIPHVDFELNEAEFGNVHIMFSNELFRTTTILTTENKPNKSRL